MPHQVLLRPRWVCSVTSGRPVLPSEREAATDRPVGGLVPMGTGGWAWVRALVQVLRYVVTKKRWLVEWDGGEPPAPCDPLQPRCSCAVLLRHTIKSDARRLAWTAAATTTRFAFYCSVAHCCSLIASLPVPRLGQEALLARQPQTGWMKMLG